MNQVRNTLAILALLAASSHGATITYQTALNGANESPVNASPGTGFARVIIDTTANTMEVIVTFTGLLGGVTASHIHCCTATPFTGTAGVATITPTFTGFPSGVTSGNYDHVFDLGSASTYNPAFVTIYGTLAATETAFLAGMASGSTYLNIHTSVVPGGEIRGFLQTTPEPATWGLIGASLLALMAARKRLIRS